MSYIDAESIVLGKEYINALLKALVACPFCGAKMDGERKEDGT